MGALSVFLRNRMVLKGVLSTAFLAAGAKSENVRVFNRTSVYQGFKFLKGIGLLTRLVELINEIDDVVDNMPAEKRLKIGEARLGNTPCNFLRNKELNLEAYFNTIEKLDNAGIISRSEAVSFSNIYAVLLTKSAKVEVNLKHGNDFEGRKQLTKLNMNIAQVLGSHILQHIMPSYIIKKKSDNSVLSVEDVLEEYPDAMKFGYLIEMCDDLEDFLIDIKREDEVGIKTPNWIATRLAKAGSLYTSDTKLSPELKATIMACSSNDNRVPFSRLSLASQEVIIEGQEYLKEMASDLPNMQCKLIQSWWNTLLSNGIKAPTKAHEDVVRYAL